MSSISFGSRAQVTTFLQKIEDATVGNKDGIIGNESDAAGSPKGGAIANNPLLFALKQSLAAGWSKADENQKLSSFMTASEKTFGGPVTSLSKPAHVDDERWNGFRLDKAISLVRLGLTPNDVSEHVVTAAGSVDGHAIAPRDVFVQRFAPQGTPSGKTIVVSPGFLESGRNYLEQANILCKEGHAVVVMDHQWAGLSSGPQGGIDRGFGIARDLAAVAAWAHADAPKNEVVLLGTSMGAGAGVVGALTMNDHDRIQLQGPAMPKGINAVLQGPFFARTSSVANATLAAAGTIPLIKEIPLPATGLPILSGDQATLRKLAAHATTESLTGRASAFHASTEDLATTKQAIDAGKGPTGKVYVIHAEGDTLADYQASKMWTAALGNNAKFHTIVGSTSHVIEENLAEQKLMLDGLKWLDNA